MRGAVESAWCKLGWAGGLALLLAVWLWQVQSTALTPPMDNVEQMVWAQSLSWGYHKHPPLPTWLLWGWQQLWGTGAGATAGLGALLTSASLLLFAQLMRQIWGSQAAVLALLAATCVTFYNGRVHYYNHNTLLTWWVVLSAHCVWQVLRTQAWRWWGALGLVAGLGLLTKYQYVLVAPTLALLLWRAGLWRERRTLWGLALAAAAAAAAVSPHALWLLQRSASDGAMGYALHTAWPETQAAQGAGFFVLHAFQWLADLLFNRCLPAWLFVALVARPASRPQPASPSVSAGRLSGSEFLLLWGLTPVLSIWLLGAVAHMDLQKQWGTAFALGLVPVGMRLAGWPERSWRVRSTVWLVAGLLLIHGVLLWHAHRTSAAGCCMQSRYWRNFDSPALARSLDASVRAQTGGPVRILVGSAAVAGAVALALPERPKVLIGGRLSWSPWLSEPELRSAGVGLVELLSPGSTEPGELLPGGWRWRVYAPDTPAGQAPSSGDHTASGERSAP